MIVNQVSLCSDQNLIENDRFWTLASIVRSNPRALAEVRASVISLLEDDLRASSLLLDILVPPQSADVAAQRQALLAVIKLHSVARSRAMTSQIPVQSVQLSASFCFAVFYGRERFTTCYSIGHFLKRLVVFSCGRTLSHSSHPPAS